MTDTAKATPTCSERVRIDSWHDARCTRAVKDEGLCGIHLAAKRKRAANRVKGEQEFAAENQRHEAAKIACERIPGSLPHYGAYSKDGYDGRIVVPASIAYEYDALKAVEAACREHNGTPFDDVQAALAALDAIRKGPGNGKTGEAVI